MAGNVTGRGNVRNEQDLPPQTHGADVRDLLSLETSDRLADVRTTANGAPTYREDRR